MQILPEDTGICICKLLKKLEYLECVAVLKDFLQKLHFLPVWYSIYTYFDPNKIFKIYQQNITRPIKIKEKHSAINHLLSRVSTNVKIQIFLNAISNLSHALFFWFQNCMVAKYL